MSAFNLSQSSLTFWSFEYKFLKKAYFVILILKDNHIYFVFCKYPFTIENRKYATRGILSKAISAIETYQIGEFLG